MIDAGHWELIAAKTRLTVLSDSRTIYVIFPCNRLGFAQVDEQGLFFCLARRLLMTTPTANRAVH